MADKILVTDLDDCLIDFLPTWVNTLNKYHNLNVKLDDITEWDMRKAYPTLTPEDIYAPLYDKLFWESVPEKLNANATLMKLKAEGYKVLVCTATKYSTLHNKLEGVFFKHFPDIDWKDIIISYHKDLIKCDYIVDDYHENIKNSTAIRFLMDAPHNKNCDPNCYDYRVSSWDEIYKILHDCPYRHVIERKELL